jgi:hypothetical protein
MKVIARIVWTNLGLHSLHEQIVDMESRGWVVSAVDVTPLWFRWMVVVKFVNGPVPPSA